MPACLPEARTSPAGGRQRLAGGIVRGHSGHRGAIFEAFHQPLQLIVGALRHQRLRRALQAVSQRQGLPLQIPLHAQRLRARLVEGEGQRNHRDARKSVRHSTVTSVANSPPQLRRTATLERIRNTIGVSTGSVTFFLPVKNAVVVPAAAPAPAPISAPVPPAASAPIPAPTAGPAAHQSQIPLLVRSADPRVGRGRQVVRHTLHVECPQRDLQACAPAESPRTLRLPQSNP